MDWSKTTARWDEKYLCFGMGSYQSGTKPNLVAKIWPPNLVTICAWLPKLVANVSSNFHHSVYTGLAVDSFFQMATNNGSPHLQVRHNLSGLYLADWKWLHLIAITFNTLCLEKFYIQWCGALQWTRWLSYLKQLIISPVSEGSGDVMVLRRSRPPPAARRPQWC